MMDTLDALKRDKSALLEALECCGAEFKNNMARCVFHPDNNPSMSIYETEGGQWRYRCFACGESGSALDARAHAEGRPVADLLRDMRERQAPPKRNGDRPGRGGEGSKSTDGFTSLEAAAAVLHGLRLEAVYQYTNPASGTPDLCVLRLRDSEGRKTFRQLRHDGGKYFFGKPSGLLPLYNRSRVAQAPAVIIAEGEQCVHVLHECGAIATTSPGGAGKAALCDWSPLAAKTVYLWPDADEPGMRHMDDVRKILEALSPAPEIYEIPIDRLDLPPKGDCVDYLAEFDSPEARREALESVIDLARPVGPAGDLERLIAATIAGERRSLPIADFPILTKATRALLPGTVSILCGSPGASKSFMLLQAMAHAHGDGIPCALFELEESKAFHLQRLLALLDGDGRLTDPDHIEQRPDEAMDAFGRHKDFIESFGRCMDAAPSKQVSYKDLVAWMTSKAESGARLLGIDPITVADAGPEPWRAADQFFAATKPILDRHGASLLLVSHPKKHTGRGPKTFDLDSIAGGAAFGRFSQTVFALEFLKEAESGQVRTRHGSQVEASYNRRLHVLKSRNGTGQGLTLAVHFDAATLRMTEEGVAL